MNWYKSAQQSYLDVGHHHRFFQPFESKFDEEIYYVSKDGKLITQPANSSNVMHEHLFDAQPEQSKDFMAKGRSQTNKETNETTVSVIVPVRVKQFFDVNPARERYVMDTITNLLNEHYKNPVIKFF